jgi:hypothetical protein
MLTAAGQGRDRQSSSAAGSSRRRQPRGWTYCQRARRSRR